VCQPAGLGSFALALKELGGSADGEQRRLHAALDVVHVSEQGALLSAPFASFDFLPGGLDISPLQIYDYDDDGKRRAHCQLRPEGGSRWREPGAPGQHLVILGDRRREATRRLPELEGAERRSNTSTSICDRTLATSLRTWPTWARLRPQQCPPRVTGPRFFWHSLPDGGFSRNDAAARAALKRACPKKPEAIVVDNAAQTAKNLVCARAYGVSIESANSALSARHEALCGPAPSCAFATTLETWAKALPPVSLAE